MGVGTANLESKGFEDSDCYGEDESGGEEGAPPTAKSTTTIHESSSDNPEAIESKSD